MKYTTQDLVDINKKIEELHAKRGEILQELRLKNLTDTVALSGDKKTLYEFIAANPGCNRQQINEILLHLERLSLRNLLTYMRKNRGLIKPQGSRNQTKWYIV